ncbi:thiamine-monophosphate kinase [mine drainage metagenome]|uniref:Thiamine-monophosphate kinase n=1 Tax=mine drainage metagenome TaxID=410659 RepID=A0A1J5PHV2_9ZZZZ
MGRDCLLSGGDDYELCFTAAAARQDEILAIGRRLNLNLSRIGCINESNGALSLLDAAGRPMSMERTGYDHFA